MRNPNRLYDFYDQLIQIHKQSFPDLRFGQLMCNFFSWLQSSKERDCFYIEENEMIEYLKEYANKYSNDKGW